MPKKLHFERPDYWLDNYSEPETMDAICNAEEHARYLKSFFSLFAPDEKAPIKSLLDVGAGTGILFQCFVETLKPHYALALEPSRHALAQYLTHMAQTRGQKKKKVEWISLGVGEILGADFWSSFLDYPNELGKIQKEERQNRKTIKSFDLGVCYSVFQYLSEDEVILLTRFLAKHCRYLYFSVPTNAEYRMMKREFDFVDPYAYKRGKDFYLRIIRKEFRIISCCLLESRRLVQTSLCSMPLFQL
jgi:SAM-dependent methyltransferase